MSRARVVAGLAGCVCWSAIGVQAQPAPPLPDNAYDVLGTIISCTSDADCSATRSIATCLDGACYVPKSRYISLRPNPANGNMPTARRVSLATDTTPVVLGWIGDPKAASGFDGSLVSHIAGSPVYRNWTQIGTVDVTGCAVSNGQSYLIQSIDAGQDVLIEANFSLPLELPTVPQFGDVMGEWLQPDGEIATPPNDIVEKGFDIVVEVEAFLGMVQAPRHWLDLGPEIPDGTINYLDIFLSFQAFRGFPYPYTQPVDCGPVPSCGNGVVEADENCDDGNTFPGDGCDAFCRDENTNAGMFALIPVRASGAEGSHWFLGPAANQITLTVPDQTVEFDLMISGYSPALIESYQAGFDCSSFDSGGIGALQPALVECRNVGFDGTPCNGVDLTRPDIITSQAILACNVTNVCEDGVAPGKVSCGTVLWSGSDDPGTPEYAAQFAAHVPAGTGGTFALALDPSPTWTFMIDGSGDPVGRLNLPPALITVRSDCNSNGISDQAEIAAGTVADCNGNGYPDECEEDCNGTSVPDNCDVTDGTSLDCKGNLIPDECEPDCNANLIADSCDIASAVSLDCNANSVPDECDLASGSAADCNANDIPDSCDIITGLSVDCDSGGVPDECEPNEDCNINGVQDICDVALGVSEDCNFDRVPDECQLDEDCNGNGLRDLCDIGEQTSADCNANLVPDSCDLARSTSDDFDGNGIPDECCFASAAPLADSIVPDMGFGTRNRYLSFEAGSTGQLQAIRVLPTLLPPPFDVSDCTTGSCVELWVGQPFAVSEASGSTDPTSEPTFWSASLQCGPLFTDWSQYGTIHAHGIAVVPNGTYDLQVVGELCSVTAEENFSASLQVKTTVWGDMVGSDPRTSPPQGVTDFNGLAAIVDKFMNRPGSVQKSRADVAPELVDHKVDFTDIPAVVDGFRVLPYPYIGPIPCP